MLTVFPSPQPFLECKLHESADFSLFCLLLHSPAPKPSSAILQALNREFVEWWINERMNEWLNDHLELSYMLIYVSSLLVVESFVA